MKEVEGIQSSFLRTVPAQGTLRRQKFVWGADSEAALQQHPSMLAAAVRELDSSVDHKPWKHYVAGCVLTAVDETWKDLAEAYTNGDVRELRTLDQEVAIAASHITTLPAFLDIPRLDRAMARALGRS